MRMRIISEVSRRLQPGTDTTALISVIHLQRGWSCTKAMLSVLAENPKSQNCCVKAGFQYVSSSHARLAGGFNHEATWLQMARAIGSLALKDEPPAYRKGEILQIYYLYNLTPRKRRARPLRREAPDGTRHLHPVQFMVATFGKRG